jgi:nitroimidazol reductase NimA-like FMN-containing flavoprotein (pyridoxamine 5'-phosphate oxidase superfamily)
MSVRMDRRKSIQLTPEQSLRFMEEGLTATLATNGRDGYPHLVAMWYRIKRGGIVMTTYGKSQKAVNIRRDPRATMMWESGTA